MLCYFSLRFLAGESDLEAESTAQAPPSPELPGSMAVRVTEEPVPGRGWGLVFRLLPTGHWNRQPQWLPYVTQHLIRPVSTQCWELAKYSITVYLGVCPSHWLNSFPCFLQLISSNSTTVSRDFHTRKYHQDLLLWFPECQESCTNSLPTYRMLLRSLVETYQFDMILFKMHTLLAGEDKF